MADKQDNRGFAASQDEGMLIPLAYVRQVEFPAPTKPTPDSGPVRLRYAVFGGGPRNFVIIPGLALKSVMGSAQAIAVQYRAFQEAFTTYVLDVRPDLPEGYTLEDYAADVDAALEALGVRQACVFGASMGGMVAQLLAINYPARVEALALGSTTSDQSDVSSSAASTWTAMAESALAEVLAQEQGSAGEAVGRPAAAPGEHVGQTAETPAADDKSAGHAAEAATTVVPAGAEDRAAQSGSGAAAVSSASAAELPPAARAFAEALLDKMYAPATLAKYRDAMLAANANPTPAELRKVIALTRAIAHFSCTADLPRITAPVLVLGCEGDRMVGVEASRVIAKACGGTLVTYDDTFGHAVYDEAPDYPDTLLQFFLLHAPEQ